MSYAEQYFSVRENESLHFVSDLAWFGTDSYVYHDDDMMIRTLNSRYGMLNPVSNFYLVKWLLEKNYRLSSYLPIGFTISVYNSDLDVSMHFVLYSFNDDGSANWISRNAYFVTPMAAPDADGSISYALNMEDYSFIEYLNGSETDWVNELSEIIPTEVKRSEYGFYLYSKMPGFLHGFSEEFKTILKPVKELEGGRNLLATVPSYNDIDTLTTNIPGSIERGDIRGNYFYADTIISTKILKDTVLPIAKSLGSEAIVASINNTINLVKTGAELYEAPLIDDEISAEEIAAHSNRRACVYGKYAPYTLSEIQESEIDINLVYRTANLIKICI